MLLLSVFFQHWFSIKMRVVVPMLIQLAVFTITTAIVKVRCVRQVKRATRGRYR